MMNTVVRQDDRRVRKTKKALRGGLAELLLQKNLKEITVRELTDLVDLHRGTFYVHYKDIYDLYAQIQQEITQEVEGILEQFPPSTIQSRPFPMMMALLNYMQENAAICRMLFSQNGDMSFMEQLKSMIMDKCMSDWSKIYPRVSAQRSALFTSFIVAGCVGVMHQWLDEGMSEPPEQLAKQISEVTVHARGFLEVSDQVL